MKKSTARLITCMLSNHLDNYHVGLPSSYLETIELKLIEGKYEEVFNFFEKRLETSIVKK